MPGGDKQFEHLISKNVLSGRYALIIGSGCESIAVRLSEIFSEVQIVINDYDLLIQSRLQLKENPKIKCRLMDYVRTDFSNSYFDLIFAQSSVSVNDRKGILKEIKRILNNEGLICIGEIVSLKEPAPAFVKDIWESSGLDPLPSSEIKKYYESRGFEIISESDLSHTLKDFYQKFRHITTKAEDEVKPDNKKIYNAIKHESDVYLKHGGDKYIGFKSLIMREKIEKG